MRNQIRACLPPRWGLTITLCCLPVARAGNYQTWILAVLLHFSKTVSTYEMRWVGQKWSPKSIFYPAFFIAPDLQKYVHVSNRFLSILTSWPNWCWFIQPGIYKLHIMTNLCHLCILGTGNSCLSHQRVSETTSTSSGTYVRPLSHLHTCLFWKKERKTGEKMELMELELKLKIIYWVHSLCFISD